MWHSYISVLQPPQNQRFRYVRLNPQLSDDPPRLDEIHRMGYIQEVAREILHSEDKIKKVAAHLIASTFYFELSNPMEVAPDGSAQCKGQ